MSDVEIERKVGLAGPNDESFMPLVGVPLEGFELPLSSPSSCVATARKDSLDGQSQQKREERFSFYCIYVQDPLSVVGRQPNLGNSDGSFLALSTPIFASK